MFNDDIDRARRWLESTPDEVRKSFTPEKMRKLTGFANEEYWNHRSTGRHPAPKGARLLEKLDPARQSWPYSAAELLIDLGLHLQRIWKALDALLMKHHARYETPGTNESGPTNGAKPKTQSMIRAGACPVSRSTRRVAWV